MKVYIALFVLLICNTISFSQDKEEARYSTKSKVEYEKPVRGTVKTNPLAFMVGPMFFTSEFRIVLEQKLAKRQSFQFGASYLGKSFYTRVLENNDTSMTLNNVKFIINGYRLQLTYKWYLDYHEAPQGFFIAPHFSYAYAKYTTNHNNRYAEYIEAKHINYSLIGGYQLIVNKIFALEAFSGIGYKNNQWSETYAGQTTLLDENDFVIFKGNLKIIIGFNLGIAF